MLQERKKKSKPGKKFFPSFLLAITLLLSFNAPAVFAADAEAGGGVSSVAAAAEEPVAESGAPAEVAEETGSGATAGEQAAEPLPDSVAPPAEDPGLPQPPAAGGETQGESAPVQNAGLHTVRIQYLFEESREEAAPVFEREMAAGQPYEVSSPPVNGFKADKALVSGTVEGPLDVTVLYRSVFTFDPQPKAPLTAEEAAQGQKRYAVELPEDYLPEGWMQEQQQDEETGTLYWVLIPPAMARLSAETPVTTYEELVDAIANSGPGATIHIGADIELQDTLIIDKSYIEFVADHPVTLTVANRQPYAPRHMWINTTPSLQFEDMMVRFENVTLDGGGIGGGIFVGHQNTMGQGHVTLDGLVLQNVVTQDGWNAGADEQYTNSVREVFASFTRHVALTNSAILNNRPGEEAPTLSADMLETINTRIAGNRADTIYGGAGVRVNTLMATQSTFEDNHLGGTSGGYSFGGGAVYANDVYLMDGTVFRGNTAISSGAAIRANYVYVYGGTQFVGNIAHGAGLDPQQNFGGAIQAYELFLMGENILFDSNEMRLGNAESANTEYYLGGIGGAAAVSSNLQIQGSVRFVNNKAAVGGGAIATTRQLLHFVVDSAAEFVGNSAPNGGAIAIYETYDVQSNPPFVFIAGTTRFESNKAQESGGAIYVTPLTMLEVGGEVAFGGNRAPVLTSIKDEDRPMYEQNIFTQRTSATDTIFNNFDVGYDGPSPRFEVRYESNGGSAVESASLPFESLVTRPQNPVREGYTFEGWQMDDGRVWDFRFDRVVQDIVLYAQWKAEDAVITTPTDPTDPADPTDPLTEDKEENPLPENPAPPEDNTGGTQQPPVVEPAPPTGGQTTPPTGGQTTPPTGGQTTAPQANSPAPPAAPAQNTPDRTEAPVRTPVQAAPGSGQTVSGILPSTGEAETTQEALQTGELESNPVPQSQFFGRSNTWSLLNLILTVFAVLFTLYSVWGGVQGIRRKLPARRVVPPVTLGVLGIVSVLLFVLFQNLGGQMVFFNEWSFPMLLLALAEGVLFTLALRQGKAEEAQN